MNRQLFNAMAAQYAVRSVGGDGLASWEDGKKCVIPSVKLYGAAVQDGTPTPDAPIMPMCNNGVVVSRGRNLLSAEHGMRGDFGYILGSSNEGELKTYIQKGAIYTLSFDAPMSVKTGVYLRQSGGINVASLGAGTSSVTFTPTLDSGYYLIYLYNTDQWTPQDFTVWQLELGSTPTPYTPYWDGGQAQAPELWAIPGTEYRDEWDTQTGKGIRRCAVIDSYAGETIDTPYISSTGALTEGAAVVYGIPDTPFTAAPAKLTQPRGCGQIIQVGGGAADCPITAKYLTHR